MATFDLGSTAIGDAIGMSSGSEDSANAAAKKAARLATEYYNETAAVRNPLISRLAEFMQGNFDPTASPQYASNKLGIEQNYNTAIDNLLAMLPEGGGLADGLAGIEMGRSGSLVDTIARIVQDEYNKAYGIASGSPQQTFSGFDSAANLYNPVLGGQASDKSGQYGLLSSVMG